VDNRPAKWTIELELIRAANPGLIKLERNQEVNKLEVSVHGMLLKVGVK
jgi:hypothetical protein